MLNVGKLWRDEPAFAGCAWDSEGLILFDLERRNDPGARFFEIIVLGEDGTRRARTWHWSKAGALFRRTLCARAA